MDIETIARICHEVNRGLCEALGDDSQNHWEEAAEWQQMSAISGVHQVKAGLSAPYMSHKAWMAEKLDAGWVYGEVKDEDAKTHPCLVPFEDLPVEQQLKDHLFVTTAKVLLNGE